jgi:outer membrane biosynthesis protein TonB
MTTFVLIAVALLLAILVAVKLNKKPKVDPSVDLADTLLPETNIHEEIAKTAEKIKSQDPVVIEAPFVAETKKQPKKKPAAKKPAPKTKATPKKKK